MTKKLAYSSPTSVKDVYECELSTYDDGHLCACERADPASDDTASLTQNTSLVSSFSNDEDNNTSSPSPRDHVLRHRRVRFDHPVNDCHSDSEDGSKDKYHPSLWTHKSVRHTVNQLLLHRRLVIRIAIATLLSGVIFQTITSPTFMVKQWKLPPRTERKKLAQQINSSPQQETFTLRLKGGRLDLLAASIAYHAPCPRVGEIQIDWQGSEEDPNTPRVLLEDSHAKVADRGHLNTDAVLLLDEGVTLTCPEMDRGFYGWMMQPRRPVGYFPVRHNGAYSILSDTGIFVHRLYLETAPPIQANALCEHLTLSAWISALSNEPPMGLTSRPSFSSTTLQSTLAATPTGCVPKLVKEANLGSLTPEVNLYTGRASYL